MSALTKDRNTLERFPQMRTLVAAAAIYAGALVAVNADGNAVPASDTAGLKVIGRAESSAKIGEQVRIKAGCFAYDATGITAANIGAIAYVADDQTVALSGVTNNVVAGVIFDVDDEGVWIKTTSFDGEGYMSAINKASGAEVTAGTNDTKYATAKAIKDANIKAMSAAGAIADLALTSVTGAAGSEVYAAGDSSANLIADMIGIRTKLNAVVAALRTNGIVAAE